ncbi:MAG: N-acetyltransferase [Phenylobacterium zucineum]|nr:MAG: N-acetyltransferase [Phenylobacterium zucineum]
MIRTERLLLRAWRDEDLDALDAINSDPRVHDWLGGPISREQSQAMMVRVNDHIDRHGFGFFAAEQVTDGRLIGAIGLQVLRDELPPAPGVELGWRLSPDAQGTGLATEGAAAVLAWGFANLDLDELVAFTATGNVRSQAVMRRIGMRHDPARDFDHPVLAEDHPLRRHVLFAAKR